MFLYQYILSVLASMSYIILSMIGSIPFYFAWNFIAPTYFTFLPIIYHKLPYWHIVSACIVLTFLGQQISKITPKIISISQSNE